MDRMTCRRGKILDPHKNECNDINECEEKTDNCHRDTTTFINTRII